MLHLLVAALKTDPKKIVPNSVLYYYCIWYDFLWISPKVPKNWLKEYMQRKIWIHQHLCSQSNSCRRKIKLNIIRSHPSQVYSLGYKWGKNWRRGTVRFFCSKCTFFIFCKHRFEIMLTQKEVCRCFLTKKSYNFSTVEFVTILKMHFAANCLLLAWNRQTFHSFIMVT